LHKNVTGFAKSAMTESFIFAINIKIHEFNTLPKQGSLEWPAAASCVYHGRWQSMQITWVFDIRIA